MVDGDFPPEGRLVAQVDVVHAFQAERNRCVDFHDDLAGVFDKNRRIAHAAAQDQVALFRNGCCFHHSHVHVPEEPEVDLGAEVTQVGVYVMDRPVLTP